MIPQERLSQLFIKSCSRPNFAVNLVRELFSEEIRKISGRKKERLDEEKMAYIKATVFQFHPYPQTEKNI